MVTHTVLTQTSHSVARETSFEQQMQTFLHFVPAKLLFVYEYILSNKVDCEHG